MLCLFSKLVKIPDVGAIAVEKLESAAQRALFALQAFCAELGIMDIQLRCRLYDAVVKPVLLYGCEVWMPLVSESSLEELERVHLSWSCAGCWMCPARPLLSICMLRRADFHTQNPGGSRASSTCVT